MLAVRGADVARLSPAPEDEAHAWSQLMQEGVWEGRVRRLTRDGDVRVVETRRHLRYDASGAPRDVVEYARAGNRPDGPVPDRLMAASWEIDVAPAAEILSLIAAPADGAQGSERDALYRRLVQTARIVEVNERTARLVGGNRGRALMAGQSVAAFWPVESRAILAELIVEALRDSNGGAVNAASPPTESCAIPSSRCGARATIGRGGCS